MALAKFHEDVEESYLDGTSERYERFLASVEEDRMLREARKPRPGEVHAVRNGHRFEDQMAFPVNSRIRFNVEVQQGCIAGEVELQDQTGVHSLSADATGAFLLFSKEPATICLVLKSGAHRKEYIVHYLEERPIEKIPEFAALVAKVTDNPPAWSAATFLAFRQRMEKILEAQKVPRQFAAGVIEYHLGLFYEMHQSGVFGKLLERSYELLRCFSRYSDYAALICGFYHFRINDFGHGAAINVARLPELHRVFRFLSSPYEKAMELSGESMKKAHSIRTLELLMPRADLSTLQALAFALDRNIPEALVQIAEARASTNGIIDPQRQSRLDFIEARLCRANGGVKQAASYYKKLAYSPQNVFRDEATAFLGENS